LHPVGLALAKTLQGIQEETEKIDTGAESRECRILINQEKIQSH
jgi:hypothetical protein